MSVDWDAVREQLSRALGALAARDTATAGTSTTLEVAILEAVVDIDSDQSDAVSTLGEGNRITYNDDGAVRPGQLQRLDALEAALLGDEGLLAQLRDAPDTSGESS